MLSQMRCVKIRLKPDSIPRVRDWASTIGDTRREEALATLEAETVLLEAYFLDSTPEGDFLIAVMKAEHFETAKQTAASSARPIDQLHKDFKKATWETLHELETLVVLDRT